MARGPFDVRVDLSGKVALVTGGGYGMGRASAVRFAQCGARVVVADVRADRGEETVRRIHAEGGEALFVAADVSRSEDVRRVVDLIRQTYGRLDCAHNNAGIIEAQAPVADYPEDGWHRIIATNLTSVFLCMKYEIPLMLETGGGAIVNVASETVYKGGLGDVAYTASKHGVVGATTVAAMEYADRGLRVNAVAPGNVDTGIMEAARRYLPADLYREMELAQPIGRLSDPEEMAEVVVWLCSDAAILLNGATLPADTGWNLR